MVYLQAFFKLVDGNTSYVRLVVVRMVVDFSILRSGATEHDMRINNALRCTAKAPTWALLRFGVSARYARVLSVR